VRRNRLTGVSVVMPLKNLGRQVRVNQYRDFRLSGMSMTQAQPHACASIDRRPIDGAIFPMAAMRPF